MTTAGLGQLARVTLREQALDRLRSSILMGAMPAGAHLNEVELSREMGVSRGTIREALRALEQDGLLVKGSRSRLLVREPTATDIEELYEARAALELQAGKRLLHHPNRESVLEKLEAALSAMEQENEVLPRLEKDLEFHWLIMDAAGNRILLDLWNSLKSKALIIAANCAANQMPHVMTSQFHAPIIEAFRTGDEQALGSELARHMESASVHWLEQLRGKKGIDQAAMAH